MRRPRKQCWTRESNLQRGATYKAVVTTEVKDLAGNALDQYPNVTGNQKKEWLFTIKP